MPLSWFRRRKRSKPSSGAAAAAAAAASGTSSNSSSSSSMNRHNLSIFGPTSAPHQLKRGGSAPRGRLSPPNPRSLLQPSSTSCEEKSDDLALPLFKMLSKKLSSKSMSSKSIDQTQAQTTSNSVMAADKVVALNDRNHPNNQSQQLHEGPSRGFKRNNNRTKGSGTVLSASQRTASTAALSSSLRSSSISTTNISPPRLFSSSLRNSNSLTPSRINVTSTTEATTNATTTTTATTTNSPSSTPQLRSSSNSRSSTPQLRSSSNSPPRVPCERRSSTSSAPTTKNEIRRRRSSRKSVNGLVIEFDLDDESDCILFGDCDDYEENLKPELTRQDSNQSLEELRTRLEALEHEKQSQQLPDHDEIGLGEECINKKFMEALESSHHSSSNNTSNNALDASTPSLMADLRNSFASQSGMSLLGIPEYTDEEENEDDYDDDDDEDDDGSCNEGEDYRPARSPHQPQQQPRRSTIRSSIHGLVLEYDWFSSSEDDEHHHDEDRAAADHGQ